MSPESDLHAQLARATGQAPKDRIPVWLRGVLAVVVLYLFIASVNMMGEGLKVIAHNPSGKAFLEEKLFRQITDPMTGLFVGLLVTSIVQSSSFTTSMVVGLVATGQVQLVTAIPVIMGANIGTSVTNLLVAMGSVRRRLAFRRSFAGAVVHDFFNLLTVMLLLPLEHAFGVISRPTLWAADLLSRSQMFSSDPTKDMGLLKHFFGYPGKLAARIAEHGFGLPAVPAGIIVAVLAMAGLFLALWALVKILCGLLKQRMSGLFSKALFRNGATAFVVGLSLTVMVQSSSVTTSLVVPLLGAGVLRLKQIYPYTLGANIGTTCTALLAALGTGSAPALGCALGHLLFNIYGTSVFWPLSFIPISLAKGMARLAVRRRSLAIVFLLGLFFVLPLSAIFVIRWIWG